MIQKFAEADKFADFIGVKLIEAGAGYAKAKLEINNNHLNSMGTVHGGVLFSLADFVFATACNSYGTIAVAINASISYFNAISNGIITATAKEISKHPKLSTYLIEIRNEANELIAMFQGMSYRKKEQHNF